MNRAVIAAAGLACLGAGVVPAFAVADGPVNEGRAAGTSLSFALADGGTLVLQINGVEGSNGGVLFVDAQRCDVAGNCLSTDYSSPVSASDLSVDASNPVAKLSTVLSGSDLAITWSPSSDTGPGLAGQSFDFGGDGVDNGGSTWAGQLADVSVQYGDATCKGSGGVGQGVTFDTGSVTGSQALDPVSALAIPAGAVLSCT
jgi:hypothetical protein